VTNLVIGKFANFGPSSWGISSPTVSLRQGCMNPSG
jgi:hypothetical protein